MDERLDWGSAGAYIYMRLSHQECLSISKTTMKSGKGTDDRERLTIWALVCGGCTLNFGLDCFGITSAGGNENISQATRAAGL